MKNGQYESLNDAKFLVPSFKEGDIEVWYSKDDYYRDLMLEKIEPTLETLEVTHQLIGSIAEDYLNKIFQFMQGEIWSPNGEARTMIGATETRHTSMMVRDVIKRKGGKILYSVDDFGFKKLENGVWTHIGGGKVE